MKSRARQNPFSADPFIADSPDGDWEISTEYEEYRGGEEQRFYGFDVMELRDGAFRIRGGRMAGMSLWVWVRARQSRWGLVQGYWAEYNRILLDKKDAVFIRTASGDTFYLKRNNDVFRIYLVAEVPRKNPLVHDPSMVGTPAVQLEVVKLLTEYDVDQEKNFVTRYPLYSINRGHTVTFDQPASSWVARGLYRVPDDGVYMWPNRVLIVRTKDKILLLQRSDKLRIYELRVVR